MGLGWGRKELQLSLAEEDGVGKVGRLVPRHERLVEVAHGEPEPVVQVALPALDPTEVEGEGRRRFLQRSTFAICCRHEQDGDHDLLEFPGGRLEDGLRFLGRTRVRGVGVGGEVGEAVEVLEDVVLVVRVKGVVGVAEELGEVVHGPEFLQSHVSDERSFGPRSYC